MNRKNLAALFNEWLRRYVDEPAKFQHQVEAVQQFLASTMNGKTPTYGDECVAYLEVIARELNIAL